MTTKMMVQNLSSRTTEESLSRLFSDYGAVRCVSLATDIMTGRCGGFGFVHLDEQQTGAALNALNGRCIDDRVLRVTFEQKRYHELTATQGNQSDR
jgi:RNA recognition motif-containing protein